MYDKDKLNWFFNKQLNILDVSTVSLDLHNMNAINPDIVTADNVWRVITLMSVLTKNSGACVFHKEEVNAAAAGEDGEAVLDSIRECAVYLSGKRERQTIELMLDDQIVRNDALNLLFNQVLDVPEVIICTLDLFNACKINADIVTLDNVWNLYVLISLLTVNSGVSTYNSYHVLECISTEYTGQSVLDTVNELIKYQSGTPYSSTISRMVHRL